MGIDCELLLNKIDDSIGENVIFKTYSKEELLIGLINIIFIIKIILLIEIYACVCEFKFIYLKYKKYRGTII